jgi:2-oxoglutarate ferredoxin oxidoreductase subunit alpha
MKVGYVRPISLFPFPDAALREACRNAKVIAVYENNQGQMIDDVRLSFAHPDVARMPHVRFIGGLSLDSSGFGIAPDFDVDVLSRRIEAVEAEVRA